jgi:hypothetical protein
MFTIAGETKGKKPTAGKHPHVAGRVKNTGKPPDRNREGKRQ